MGPRQARYDHRPAPRSRRVRPDSTLRTVPDSVGRRRSNPRATDPNPAEAAAVEDELTLRDFLTAWLTDIVRITVRPRTYASYRQAVRLHLIPCLGDIALAALTPAHVQAFLNAQSATRLAPRTIAYQRGILRGRV